MLGFWRICDATFFDLKHQFFTKGPMKRTDEGRHTAFRQANDPATESSRLAHLGTSAHEVLRAAVAHNGATTQETITELKSDPSDEVQNGLRNRAQVLMPRLLKAKAIIGDDLVFRDVCVDDAAFILMLRTDAEKSQFLSHTQNDLGRQVAWLNDYKTDRNQAYFIIENKTGEKVGTVRLYDQVGDSFCWGSWILKQGTPASYGIESALIVYKFALACGFKKSHFDVRKQNSSVWRFHERFGAVRTGETDHDYLYMIGIGEIQKSLARYSKYLQQDIEVEFDETSAEAAI